MKKATSIVTWRKTRTGKLLLKSTDQAIMLGNSYYWVPDFIHYLEVEVVRLQRIFNGVSRSERMNLNNACKLATRLQFNRECLHTALNARRVAEFRANREDYVNGNCT